jgi:hypothetical protein
MNMTREMENIAIVTTQDKTGEKRMKKQKRETVSCGIK